MQLKAYFLGTAIRGHAALQPEAFATEPDRDMCCLSFACACGKSGRIIVRSAALPAREDGEYEACFYPAMWGCRTEGIIWSFQQRSWGRILKLDV